MPGEIKGPSSLVNPWTAYEVMQRDDADFPGGGDGVLTEFELQSHISRLAQERNDALAMGAPTGFVDSKISDARELKLDMKASGMTAVQYLPDNLMVLPMALKKRASELLLLDDIGALGTIDQFVIDHARERYADMLSFGSAATVASGNKALLEITQLAAALGLN